MNVFVILLVTMLIAFLIESLIEFFVAPLFNNFTKLKKFKWMQMYIACAIGIASAFIYRLDLVSLLSQFLSQISEPATIIPISPFGIVITGAAIGRGSNYLHDLVMKFFTKYSLTSVINASSEDSTN